jgi:alanyl-tRNA synthetase
MESSNDIRKAFLDYFAANGHEIVSSSPLIPHNDPTLMFVNSGMVQFKNVFTGVEGRDYNRATTSQKCVRAGGKHNDLDNVGYTARHHTFFEMLGNFSFGDYFKDLAIELAWNLVTREYGLAADRLWVTVYAEDDQAAELWHKIAGLPEERIVRVATSDNFWAMGETGPCGPCSEIFYDHGPALAGGPPGSPDEDGDRYVEIWNLVFMQYEQVTPDERVDLPRPSIDTGMGLERIAAVLQGKHDNYDTDGLRGLILASAEASGVAPDGEHAVAHRVIADHLRATSFLIADGVMPSNEGRGYVLRRIMRRAMGQAELMGCDEPVMWRLVPALTAEMGQVYPELVRAEALITETLKLEESRFKQNLARGLRLLDEELAQIGETEPLPGEVAFRLYDTYGFPLDLTQDTLRRRGRAVDTAGFEVAMERQRAEARAAWAGSGAAATEAVWLELRDRVGASEFLGYATEVAEGEVRAIVVDGEPVDRAADGAEATIVLNQTPFYGEAGGQMGDSGVMFTADGVEVAVRDTQRKADDLFIHVGEVRGGTLSVGDAVEMRVNGERRQSLRLNHSATHLLHEALRRTLGDHVTQKGSLVAPDRLRFDFSHPKPMNAEEVTAVEREVNRRVRENAEVVTHLMSPDEAVEAGALALFGEKYGEEVRVVSMGADDGAAFSTELCGGTHVRRTGDIGFFKVIGESAIAAGVRRIEALTGESARGHTQRQEDELHAAARALKAAPGDVAARVAALIDERKKLERELDDTRRRLASGGGGAVEARDVGGVRFAGQRLEDVPAKALKSMVDDLKRLGPGVYAVVAVTDSKASLVVGVTEDLEERYSAVELVRVGVAELGGKGGGGRPDMAQGGGPEGANAEAALAAIERAIEARAAN